MVATMVTRAIGVWPSATPCRTETRLGTSKDPVNAEGVTVRQRGAGVNTAMVVDQMRYIGVF